MFILIQVYLRFISISFAGKNRLYPTYSVSSSEAEDSPVHNHNHNNNNNNHSKSSKNYTKGHYNLPYTPSPQYTLTYKQTAGLSETPSSSDNASDATLTDTELALARDNTLLVNNGKFI